MAKRNRVQIVGDMLSVIQQNGGEIKPTHLMYKANLSHMQMRPLLEELLAKELVARVKKHQYDYFIITEKGVHLSQKLKEMREFEKTFGL